MALPMSMLSIEQIKAARVMLNLKQKELAAKAGISTATLNNIERGVQTDPKLSTLQAIREALEREGIEFISAPLGGLGIMLKPRRAASENATILVIDDNQSDRMLYRSWLHKAPGKQYRVHEADSARTGFDAYKTHQPHCIILDFMMRGADGLQLLSALEREHTKLPPVIFVSGMQNHNLKESASAHGVHCYINKNTLSRETLMQSVETALKIHAV